MRRKRKSTQITDAILGLLIPLAFLALAGYQQATTGNVDKYVIGALMVFGLGALGWRIDTIIEKYLEARAQGGIEQSGGTNREASARDTPVT